MTNLIETFIYPFFYIQLVEPQFLGMKEGVPMDNQFSGRYLRGLIMDEDFSIAEETRLEVVENWFERVLIVKITAEVSLFITRLSKGIRFRILKSPKQQTKL